MTSLLHSISVGFVIAAMSACAAGCEETVDITGAAYVERLVVHGVLEPDSTITVSVRRTLPLDVQYDSAAAAVTDASVAIVVSDQAGQFVERLSLTRTGGAIYSSITKARSGYRYNLVINWRGKAVTASTRVPEPVAIDSARAIPIDSSGSETFYGVRLAFRPRPAEAYVVNSGSVDERTGGRPVPHNAYGGAQILRQRDTNALGWITHTEATIQFPEQVVDHMVAFVGAYDIPYYDFYRTYYTYDGGGPFSTGADLVRWNIEGDGIGLFIGRANSWRAVER